LKAGIAPPKITFDPGIGFGKSLDQNLEILRRLTELRSLGRPLLLGVSRKSFIAHITGEERPADWRERAREGEQGDGHVRRLGGTAAAVTLCVMGGADVLRVHDVAVMSEAVQVASALRDGMTL
jgi:dihydropteroate synthase